MSGELRKQRRFEHALRLTLDLYELIEIGQDESEHAERIREALDMHTGWSPDPCFEWRLTTEELKILSQISVMLQGDT